MKAEIISKPSYSTLSMILNQWESIKVEPGSMVAMDASAEIVWKAQWWILKWLTRKFLTGESFFVTDIKANKDETQIYLAPRSVGDIETIKLDGSKSWIVQWGWFLASTNGIETSTKFEGLKWFFSWEGLFMIRVSWSWYCFVSSFWGIIKYEVSADEEFIVDNSHIVAFEDTLNYTIDKAWKWLLNSVKTWEGLVCRFSWSWTVYIQSRNPQSFAETLNPFMANSSNSKWGSGLLGGIFGD